MTSSGGMLPEVHVGAEVLHEVALRGLCRRLEDNVAGCRSRATISSISPVRISPFGRKMPAVPPSRPSVITFQAPASSSSLIQRDPLVGREDRRLVLRPDLGEHDEVACELGDQLELLLALEADRPVRDLDVGDAVVGQPAFDTRRACRARRPPRRACRRRPRVCRTSGRARPSRAGCSSRRRCPSRASGCRRSHLPISKSPSTSWRVRPLSMTCVMPRSRGFGLRAGTFRKPSTLEPGIEILESLRIASAWTSW